MTFTTTVATNLPVTITLPAATVSGTTQYIPSPTPETPSPSAPDPRLRARAKAARQARKKSRR